MLSEFELIDRYFTWSHQDKDITQSVGDDAALLNINNKLFAISVDTLIEGRHFLPDISPADLAYKSLAVNLSDLAAMGATPKWFTLALTIPHADENWLHAFSAQLKKTAQEYHLALIGGNTACGPMNISIQMMGVMEKMPALLRSHAKVGDKIYVSGTLGDAGCGLHVLQKKITVREEDKKFFLSRLMHPTPRVTLGQALVGVAHAAIDISDGLAADLQHILTASKVGARLFIEKLPLSLSLRDVLSVTEAQQLALTAGDDYELCFTVPPQMQGHLEQIAQQVGCLLTEIGEIVPGHALQCLDAQGRVLDWDLSGWQHFG